MKDKKDILFLCQFFYPEYVSSATLPFDTAVALSNHGFSVDVLCGYPKEYTNGIKIKKRENVNNISIQRVKYLSLKRASFIGRLLNYFSFAISILFHLFKFKNYKTVMVYSNPPVLPFITVIAKKLFKISIIFVCYDIYPEIAIKTNSISSTGIISKIMNQINKSVFNNITTVVALSSDMKKSLIANRKLEEAKINIIPNWYDEDIDYNSPNNYFADKYKDKFVVSYFGNMGTCQDIDTILSAIRKLSDDHSVQFIFAGHGNKVEVLKNTKKTENLINIDIYDFLHDKEFIDALMISHCFVVSLCEGLTGLCVPSKTYSYMAMGKPIIAVMDQCDITNDLLENNAGFAFINNDVNNFIEAIKHIKNNEELRMEMGNNCKNLFLSKYTKQICTMKYVELLGQLLDIV